jgi:hypothetical protein
MKKILFSVSLLACTGAYAQEENGLILSNIICANDTCDSNIINSNKEIIGNFFLSKKTNPTNGTSIYTTEVVNTKDNLNDSNIIVCLKNHQCRLYKSNDGFKADYAYINNEFFSNDRKKENVDNSHFKMRADQFNLYEGNENLNIIYPIKNK